MLYVNEETGEIQLTRGDTARLSVSVENEIDGSEYTPSPNDIFKFTVKKNYKMPEFVLQKVSNGSANFHIEPSDTHDLPFGKYEYDVELTTASGDVYTVIVPTSFELLKEVTY